MNRIPGIEYFDADADHPIGMTKRVKKEYDAWDDKTRGGFIHWFKVYGKDKGDGIPEEKFTFEDRLKPKGAHTAIAIYAFKQFKHRLYGFEHDGQFLITECDGSKKRNKADPEALQRAADRAPEYMMKEKSK